jgi:cholesterol transport system auxiliary component
MKYATLVVFLFLSGCTVTQPAITEYKLHPQTVETHFDITTCKQKSIKIAQTFSSSALMSQKMHYAKDMYGEYTFNQSEWSDSPNKAITAELVKSIRDSHLFMSVQSYKSRSISEYTLESTIEEFMQYFSDDNASSYVEVIISMTLIDTESGQVIDSMLFIKKVDAKTPDAQGGVVALNEALSDVLRQGNLWLSKACK